MTSTLLAAAALAAAGCATTPPRELQDARYAYQRASLGPAADLKVPELAEARAALDAANKSFADHQDSERTRTLAYVALRRAERAEVRARTIRAQRTRAAADAELAALSQEERARTEQELADARAQLEEAQRIQTEAKARQAELDRQRATEEASRTEAEAKAQQQAQAEEQARLREELARRDAQLEEERQARAETERRLQEAAQAEQQARAEADARAKEAAAQLEKLSGVGVKEEPRGTVITLSGTVLFASGKSELLPGAKRRLDEVAGALEETDNKLTIEGHTDSKGPADLNEELSRQRAEAVHEYLVRQGVADDRIRTVGRGEDDPVADNKTAEGRAINRRVEIVLERGGT